MLIPNRKYMMTQTINGKKESSRVQFVATSRRGNWLVFEDLEEFYWGNLPVTNIKFVVPAEHWPAYEYKSFGQTIECTFELLN